jgi:hypothetical protein
VKARPGFHWMLACVLACVAAPAAAREATLVPTPYVMSPESDMVYGCFPPCLCPTNGSGPIEGGFLVSLIGYDSLFEYYEIAGVDWTFSIWDYFANELRKVRVQGSGAYQVGGEFARVQRMTLDVSLDGEPPQRFDSGLVPAGPKFPAIDISVWLHAGVCFDTLFEVRASPAQAAGVGGQPFVRGLGAPRPNPFRASTEIGFALSSPGRVRLAVLDLAGRDVRTLAAGEYPAGASRVVWDGRDDGGSRCRPGVYFAVMRDGLGQSRRAIVRVE